MINDFKTRSNIIVSQFRFLSIESKRKIFNTQCRHFYGGSLISLDSKSIKAVDTSWRVCSRRVLGLSPRTHNLFIPYLINAVPPSIEISCRMINFFKCGLENKNNVVSNIFRNCLMCGDSIMFRNVNSIARKLHLPIQSIFDLPKKLILNDLFPKNSELLEICNIITEVLMLKNKELSTILAEDEILILLEDLCTR